MEQKYHTPAFLTSDEIKQVRKKLNMTQKEFAGLVGVSKPTVERWESSAGRICFMTIGRSSHWSAFLRVFTGKA